VLNKILERSIENLDVTLIAASFLTFAWYFLIDRKRIFSAALMLLFSIVVIGMYRVTIYWFWGLGGDSFLEASGFDVSEALFWAANFPLTVPMYVSPKVMALVAAEAFVISIVVYRLIRRVPKLIVWMAISLLVAHLHLLYAAFTGFDAARNQVLALEKQFDRNPFGFKTSEDIDLFVYIGESTSSLNMSLYGYPLTTTPKLDALYRENEGFLRFDKVRSTHTHTSPSLLRALSVTSPEVGGGLKQWGIGNVLNSAGLTPQLFSVQPVNGSFATSSKFIFEGMNLEIPKGDRYMGNHSTPKVKDHVLLETALKKEGVVFFHSYAGHGPYLPLIEQSMSQVLSRPNINFEGVFGSSFLEPKHEYISNDVATYDQAITYIDRNVSWAIEDIKKRTRPAVIIYFSDHGDSVYGSRGHDSGNFIDEMSTIPLVMFFNDAYRKKYPKVFAKYRNEAAVSKTRILDQISSSILDLLRIESAHPLDVPELASSRPHPRPYIVERDTLSGLSRLNLVYDEVNGFSKETFVGGTAEPTYISIINERFGHQNPICYHRADSFSKALRAASVANCIEFDLMVDGEKLLVYHPPATSTGFSIEHVFDIASARKNKLWIDSKNLDDPKACYKLLSYLEKNSHRVGQVLVEFPWSASLKLADLKTCGEGLKSMGVRTSYYLPTHFLLPCAEDSIKNARDCVELESNLRKATDSGIFTDLSFDFLGYMLVKRIQSAKTFKWNTWAIQARDFHKFPREDFDFVIMATNSDPNTY
jgi:hypothetical protein